jgi:hypothetical protein
MTPNLRAICAALLALLTAALISYSAWSAGSPPNAVTQAIAASPSPDSPAQVVVGAYINDIQELDFKANNYVVDLYVWFRWKGGEVDPSKTMEFMNRYASDDNVREALYDKPVEMPDGDLYSIIRYQGRFATKFPLEKYPFDAQVLKVVMEDTVSGEKKQVYLPDADGGINLNPQITLPGFKVGRPSMTIASHRYPTNFGDLSEPEATGYSRLTLSIPVTRPIVAVDQDLRADRPDRGVLGARLLRAATLHRRSHRARHHRPFDARRPAARLRLLAARRRLSNDDRQDLPACLCVHHRRSGPRGRHLVAERRRPS